MRLVSGPAALVFCLACHVQAQEAQSLKVSGFGTLGLAWNSAGDAEFLRNNSQPGGATRHPDGRIDTRLGLQLDERLSDTVQATLQVVSKYRYDRTFTPDVSWAFLGWNPHPEWRARLGRLGVELLMNADSQDVGYSYLWVRPPVEDFGLIPLTRIDGADLTAMLPLGPRATLRLKAYYGATSEKEPLDGEGTLDFRGDRLGGLIAEVQTDAWRVRLAYARFTPRRDFTSPIADLEAGLEAYAAGLSDPGLAQAAGALSFSRGTLQWFMAGLCWEEGPFQSQAMLTRLDSDRLAMPSNWAGSLSLGYRLGRVVPYGLWARVCSKQAALPDLSGLAGSGDPAAQALAQDFVLFVQSDTASQSTVAAGLRWDFRSRMDCKLQVDRVQGRNPDALWDRIQPGWNGRATVISAALDFVF